MSPTDLAARLQAAIAAAKRKLSWAEVKTIPGFAVGLTAERIEDWEYGDYGARYVCEIFYDFVLYLACWRFAVRIWPEG